MSCQSDYLSLIQTNTHLNHFTADTTIYAVFINGLYIGSKFCLTATFKAFTVNYTTKDQQCFQDGQFKTIRPKKKSYN